MPWWPWMAGHHGSSHAGVGFHRCPGGPGWPAMTDDKSPPDSQPLVVYEVDGEQEDASQAGTDNPLADEARKRLGKILRDIMETALGKHELWREVRASITRMIAADPATDAAK